MRLDYMAHSCFLLEHEGYKVVFDPYHPSIGYPAPRLYSVNLIVVSHDHHDHNGISQVSGASQVVRGVARRPFGPLTVDGVVAWHGEGEDADPVSLTLMEWDNYRIAHFGDLGCSLQESQLAFFRSLDLLLIPCGGGYTIDGAQAARLVKALAPKVVVPMHYQTPFLDRKQFPNFQTEEPFLQACKPFCESRFVREGWVSLEEFRQSESPTTVLHLQHQMA